MNRKEALHALVDGKLVRVPGHEEVLLHMDADGQIRNQNGSLYPLPARDGWELYEPANPHAKGTFSWAREEARRGRRVRRPLGEFAFHFAAFRPTDSWALEHVDATDWEVV